MGLCRYCGRPAGLFRREHHDCAERHDQALAKIKPILEGALNDTRPADELQGQVNFIACDGLISPEELKALAQSKFTKDIERVAADHLLSQQEDERFGDLCHAFDLSPDAIGSAECTLLKARVLRGLDEGEIVKIDLDNQEVWLHGEQPVWEFTESQYFTTHTRVQYIGGSHGVSVRVAKGVYYRASSFHGEPVRTEELVEQGVGSLVVTTESMVFDSPGKAIRLPFKKILSVHAYPDAIEVLSDGINKRPAIFKVDDPSFAANLLGRLRANNEEPPTEAASLGGK